MIKKQDVWTTQVRVASSSSFLDFKDSKVILELSGRSLRWRKLHAFTYADPFLLTDKNKLWVFLEEQRHQEHGKIIALSTSNLVDWQNHGVVLEEPTHLSYPQVFKFNDEYWMIPESSASGKVYLYRAQQLPGPWSRTAELLSSPYVDSSIFLFEGFWYLWATDSQNFLRLYFSRELSGAYTEHPSSPISSDLRFVRCGGRVQFLPNVGLVRLAQDGTEGYGKYLHLMLIKQLTPEKYKEELINTDILPRDQIWNKDGGHHIDLMQFQGKNILAIDGRTSDSYWNIPARIFWGLFRRIFN